jgi:hypothetical protein
MNRDHHGQGQGPEEHTGDPVQEGEGDEDHHRREGGPHEGVYDLADRDLDRLQPTEAGGHPSVNRLHHDDRVVDHEADGGGDAPERHHVEAEPRELHRHQRDQHRHRDDNDGGRRHSPVLEEQVQDQHREDEPEENGVADAPDRVADEERLVVVVGGLEVGRQVPLEVMEDAPYPARDVQGAAVGLAADVEEHGGDALRSDDVEDGLGSTLDAGEVPDAHGVGSHRGHREVLDLLDAVDPPVHDREVERVVLLVHAGGGDQVASSERLRDLGEGQAGGKQTTGVDHHVVLGRAAAHEVDAGDPRDPKQPRLHLVAGDLPQLHEVAPRAGEADPDDREGGEGQPPDRGAGRGRQLGADLGDAAVHVVLRLDHVDPPVEEDAHVGRAAPRGGAHGEGARDVLHALLDGPRDGGHHLVGRHHAVVDEDHDPGEIRLGKHGRGRAQRGVHPGQAQRHRDEGDRQPVADRELTDAGGHGPSTRTLVSGGRA